jgi:hypothetical protein
VRRAAGGGAAGGRAGGAGGLPAGRRAVRQRPLLGQPVLLPLRVAAGAHAVLCRAPSCLSIDSVQARHTALLNYGSADEWECPLMREAQWPLSTVGAAAAGAGAAPGGVRGGCGGAALRLRVRECDKHDGLLHRAPAMGRLPGQHPGGGHLTVCSLDANICGWPPVGITRMSVQLLCRAERNAIGHAS